MQSCARNASNLDLQPVLDYTPAMFIHNQHADARARYLHDRAAHVHVVGASGGERGAQAGDAVSGHTARDQEGLQVGPVHGDVGLQAYTRAQRHVRMAPSTIAVLTVCAYSSHPLSLD